MSSFSEFLKVANSWAVWASDMCDYFEDESGHCGSCPCTKVDGSEEKCLLSFSNWLKGIQYEEWAHKLIEDVTYPYKPNADWETERRLLMENCDRLAAEVCQLEIQIDELKKNGIENQILRNRLTKETLANLEMQIAIDLHEIYAKEREEDVYSES